MALRQNGGMPLFRRNRPDAATTDGLAEVLGHEPRALGWGTGPRVRVVALAEGFAWQVGQDPWRVVVWEQVRTGGWKQESSQMWWRLVDGSSEQLMLDEENTFPTVFRDRVQASIAFQKRIELRGGEAVVIAARRAPAATETKLVWDVMPLGGASLDDPAVRSEVDDALAELKADYDI